MITPSSYLPLIAVWTLAGFVLGLGYFSALRRTVDLFAGGGCRRLPVALTLGRLAAAILFLIVAAWFGALPLLTAFLGFVLARALALRAARRIA